MTVVIARFVMVVMGMSDQDKFECDECEFTTTVEVLSENHEEDKGHKMVVKWTQPDFDGYLP
jgi:hypothetical protein